MKNLNELYAEVVASDALKAEFLALKTPEEIVAFAKKYGCDATLNDIKTFLEEKQKAVGELSEAELEQTVGGKSAVWYEAVVSVATVGVGCGMYAGISLLHGEVGTAIRGEGMLCGV